MGPWRLFLRVWLRLIFALMYVSPSKDKVKSTESSKKTTTTTTTTATATTTTTATSVVPTTAPTRPTTISITPASTGTTQVSVPPTTTVPPTATTPRTPLEDPRVGWMYTLSKDELKAEMRKFGLSTEGTSTELRKAFVDFWRQPFGSIPQSAPYCGHPHTATAASSAAVAGAASGSNFGNFLSVEEGNSVREILGLSPNADTEQVKRVLASVVQTSRARTDMEYGLPVTHAPRFPAAPTNLAYSSLYHGNIPVPTVSSAYPALTNDLGITQLNLGPTHDTRRPKEVPSICNTVRKWNLRFDGRKDPVSFLERLEELLEAYSITSADILKALPELLTGSALLWYRNSRDLWTNYNEFRSHFELQFLPPGYRRNLDEEIRKRTQGELESFKEFVIALNTLIRRRGSISAHDKLDLIFTNMRPEYKLMVRRQDCLTLSEMIKRAEDYETYLRDKSVFRPPPAPSVSLIPETAYHGRKRQDRTDSAAVDPKPAKRAEFPRTPSLKPREPVRSASNPAVKSGAALETGTPPTKEYICWNCDKTGHFFRDCPKPKTLKCFYCKTEGISTAKCTCEAGNEYRVQYGGGRLNPRHQTRNHPPKSGASGSKR